MKDWTLKQVQSAQPGRHRIAQSLYLYVSPDKSVRRFLFRFTKPSTGRVTEHGLGNLDVMSLAEARAKAHECRRMVSNGEDPVEAKREEQREARITGVTFAAVAADFIEVKSRTHRNANSVKNDRLLLMTHAAALCPMPVASIGTTHVSAALRPLWLRSPDLARRTQAAVLRVIRRAKAQGLGVTSAGEMRDDLKVLLPTVKNGGAHHFKALDYARIPAFVRELRAVQTQGEALSPAVIEFILLTACRLSEACGMQWGEIDWQGRIWTLPAERSKTATEHRVPLCHRAIVLLLRQRGAEAGVEPDPNAYVWPSRDGAGHINGKAVYKYLTETMGVESTVHGFRSSFRTWAGNETHADRVTCELALGHAAGDGVEVSYMRGDVLDKRRKLMDAWSDYCSG